MSPPSLYGRDFHAWTHEQVSLLRAGRLADADIAHIVEEIESMGRSEKRELVSCLTVLLLHLLKWQYQPMRRGPSWQVSIAATRDALTDHLADNPSLRASLETAMATAYRRARRDASLETGLHESVFPSACPFGLDAMMDEAFWPAG